MGGRLLYAAAAALVVLALGAQALASPGGKTVRIALASPVHWTTVGDHLSLTGKVSPHHAALRLTLQERPVGGSWRDVADGTSKASGAFSFTTTPAKVGLTNYRVVTPKGAAYAGASTRVPVRVLHWVYLDSIDEFSYVTPISGESSSGPIDSAKVHYDHSVSLDAGCYNQWDGSAWIDYTLAQRYEMFTATVGMDDASAPTIVASWSIIGGGKQLAAGSVSVGKPIKVKVSLDGVYRLRLHINVPDPNHAGGCSVQFPKVVFGNAELLGP